jgi:predicted nucleotidyltransferase component of viral defense system
VLSDRQIVELFHLQFVRLLCAGPDKDRFAIKGGCNLRFFFESVRYSEDIDLDVARLPVHVLKEKVTRILGGPALALPLRSRGIAVVETSAPKQTETTQRWKVALSAEGRSLPLHTKIEFSRRGTKEDSKVESVAASVLAEYGLMPVLAPHYPLAAAIRQKIAALIHRGTVQARDVFDLSVLVAKAGGNAEVLRSARAQAPKAIERCMEVSYDDYKAQVVSHLKPDQIEALGPREAWDALQSQVVEFLEKAPR